MSVPTSPSIPGFPIEIEPCPTASPDLAASLMEQFHAACQQGNTALANDIFMSLRMVVNDYALHHLNIVYQHIIVVDAALFPVQPRTMFSPDEKD